MSRIQGYAICFSPFVFLSPVAVVTDYCLRTRSSNSTGVSTSMKQNRDMNSAPAGVFASRSDRRWRSREVITCAPAAMARSTYMLSFGSFGCTKTDGTGSTNVAYAETSSTNASVRAADRLSLRTRTGREATSASSARMDRLTNKLIRPDWTSLKQAPQVQLDWPLLAGRHCNQKPIEPAGQSVS